MSHGWAALAVVAALVALVGFGASAEQAVAQGDAATTHHIQGTVVDEDNTPADGLFIATMVSRRTGPVSTSIETSEGTYTGSDGTFTLPIDAGSDVVQHLLYVNSHDFSECTITGYGDGEVRGPAIFRPEEGDIEGLQVTLAGPPRTSGPQKIECSFAPPLLRIEGSVRRHDGRPLRDVRVEASPAAGGDTRTAPATDSSGRFGVEVPDGTYTLRVFVDYDDGRCLLGVYSNGTVVPSDLDAERLDVGNSHVTGVTMGLPRPLEELCRRVSGVVTNASGEPLSGQGPFLQGQGRLEHYLRDTNREEDGTFTLYVAEGSYSVELDKRAGDRCHLDPAFLDIDSDGPAGFIVGDQGVAELRVIVSGLPSPPDALDALNALDCSIPPASITTRLQPGWNLAGWTDIEAGVEALFATLPDLQSAHAWDAEAQAFRSASRLNGDVSGDLAQLSPGMGLWLYVGGTSPVEWRRPVVPEAARTFLAAGWNLIVWSGEDRVTPEDAFASLGSEFEAAARWDPATQQFGFFAGADAGPINNLGELSRGEGVWVYVSTGRIWLQPDSPGAPTE